MRYFCNETSLWVHPTPHSVGQAVLYTVAYADIFAYPLTVAQIQRYLVGMVASSAQVKAALMDDSLIGSTLVRRDAYYMLRDREAIADLRLHRADVAAQMWPWAIRYGRVIAALPFVRMVALTGALSMDNVESGDDFDYFIVVEPGRLWLTRALVVGLVVRMAARRGDVVCPNYLVSERALAFEEHNLYTAHELVQMIPLSGELLYRKLRDLNLWTVCFLPNAEGPPRKVEISKINQRPGFPLAEKVLRTPVGTWFEHWEQERKIHKFTQQIADQTTVSFSADQCKGHFQSHEHTILNAFVGRIQRLDDFLC